MKFQTTQQNLGLGFSVLEMLKFSFTNVCRKQTEKSYLFRKNAHYEKTKSDKKLKLSKRE